MRHYLQRKIQMTEEEISVQDQYEDVLKTGDDAAISEFLNQQNISDVAELIYENEEREIDIFCTFPCIAPRAFLKFWSILPKKEL